MPKKQTRFGRNAEHAHKMAMALIVAVGLILFWRGIWEGSQAYLTPTQSMSIGLGVLIVSGVATRIFLLGTQRW